MKNSQNITMTMKKANQVVIHSAVIEGKRIEKVNLQHSPQMKMMRIILVIIFL